MPRKKAASQPAALARATISVRELLIVAGILVPCIVGGTLAWASITSQVDRLNEAVRVLREHQKETGSKLNSITDFVRPKQ